MLANLVYEAFFLVWDVCRAGKLGFPFVVMPMHKMNPSMLGLNPLFRTFLCRLPFAFLGTRAVDSQVPRSGHGVTTAKSPF